MILFQIVQQKGMTQKLLKVKVRSENESIEKSKCNKCHQIGWVNTPKTSPEERKSRVRSSCEERIVDAKSAEDKEQGNTRPAKRQYMQSNHLGALY